MTFDTLKTLPPRILHGSMAALLALLALAGYLYLFKAPLAEAARQGTLRSLLEAKTAHASALGGEVAALEGEVAKLSRRLQGERSGQSLSELVAQTVGRLDELSRRHQVQLVSVKPGQSRPVPLFEELPFAIEVSGDYFHLYRWLQAVEGELGPLVVKSFAVRPQHERNSLAMNLSLAAYRPLKEAR